MNNETNPIPAPVRRLVGQLRELLEKGTPRPWETYQAETLNTRVYSINPTIRNVTVCRHPCASIQAKADARLIAAAINSLPALLAIAEAAAVVSAQRNGPYLMADVDATLKAESDLRTALSLLPNPSDQRPATAGPMHRVVGCEPSNGERA